LSKDEEQLFFVTITSKVTFLQLFYVEAEKASNGVLQFGYFCLTPMTLTCKGYKGWAFLSP